MRRILELETLLSLFRKGRPSSEILCYSAMNFGFWLMAVGFLLFAHLDTHFLLGSVLHQWALRYLYRFL